MIAQIVYIYIRKKSIKKTGLKVRITKNDWNVVILRLVRHYLGVKVIIIEILNVVVGVKLFKTKFQIYLLPIPKLTSHHHPILTSNSHITYHFNSQNFVTSSSNSHITYHLNSENFVTSSHHISFQLWKLRNFLVISLIPHKTSKPRHRINLIKFCPTSLNSALQWF